MIVAGPDTIRESKQRGEKICQKESQYKEGENEMNREFKPKKKEGKKSDKTAQTQKQPEHKLSKGKAQMQDSKRQADLITTVFQPESCGKFGIEQINQM